MSLRIKPEYAGVVIGFKNKSLPLGQRTEADILSFFERAKARGNKTWLSYFDQTKEISKEEIDTVKEKSFTEKQSRKTSRKSKERE